MSDLFNCWRGRIRTPMKVNIFYNFATIRHGISRPSYRTLFHGYSHFNTTLFSAIIQPDVCKLQLTDNLSLCGQKVSTKGRTKMSGIWGIKRQKTCCSWFISEDWVVCVCVCFSSPEVDTWHYEADVCTSWGDMTGTGKNTQTQCRQETTIFLMKNRKKLKTYG